MTDRKSITRHELTAIGEYEFGTVDDDLAGTILGAVKIKHEVLQSFANHAFREGVKYAVSVLEIECIPSVDTRIEIGLLPEGCDFEPVLVIESLADYLLEHAGGVMTVADRESEMHWLETWADYLEGEAAKLRARHKKVSKMKVRGHLGVVK